MDVHARLLRYVYEEDTNVNVELVLRGAAAAYLFRGERGRFAGALLAATEEARAERPGMWGACRVTWTRDRSVTTRSR